MKAIEGLGEDNERLYEVPLLFWLPVDSLYMRDQNAYMRDQISYMRDRGVLQYIVFKGVFLVVHS